MKESEEFEDFEALLEREYMILEKSRVEIDRLKRKASQVSVFRPIIIGAILSSIVAGIFGLFLYLTAGELSTTSLYLIFGLSLSGLLIAVLAVIWRANFELLSNIEEERRNYSNLIRARRRIDDITLELIARAQERKESR